MLSAVVESLASIKDLDYVFTQNFTDNVSDLGVIKGTLFSIIFGASDRFLGTGLRQDTVKKNPLRNK